MALENISSSIQPVDPKGIFFDGYELSNQSIIPSQLYSGSFTPGLNNIEFYVYSQGTVRHSQYRFTNYQITENSNPNQGPQGAAANQTFAQGSTTNTVNLFPEEDVYNAGFTQGTLTAVYNFINLELSSSINDPFYLAEISSDRTEIRLKTNNLDNDQLNATFVTFEQQLRTADFFDEFYISFGNNEYHIGVNTKLDIPEEEEINGVPTKYSVLIKLYDPLPPKYEVNDELYVLTKTGETQAFQVEFEDNIEIPDDTIGLRGPNINIKIKDFINNSTTYQNEDELLNTNSSGSKDQLLNKLDSIHVLIQYFYFLIILQIMKQINSINGILFKRMCIVGIKEIIKKKEDINKINIFPVPDGDTGDNLCFTLSPILDISYINEKEKNIAFITQKIADVLIYHSKGNSGSIFTQFFQQISIECKEKEEISIKEFCDIIYISSQSAKDSLINPQKGTIVTIMSYWSLWLKENHKKYNNFHILLYNSVIETEKILNNTWKYISILKKNKTIDAGAQGFFLFIYGIGKYIKNITEYDKHFNNVKNPSILDNDYIKSYNDNNKNNNDTSIKINHHINHNDLQYQYCTEFILLIKNIDINNLKKILKNWGNSIVLVSGKRKIKVHIHTNDPYRIFNIVKDLGTLLSKKIDDMWLQYRKSIKLSNDKKISIITDSSVILEQSFIVKYDIRIIPLQIIINNISYLHRVNISDSDLKNNIKKYKKFSTSCPTIYDINNIFKQSIKNSNFIIGIFLSKKLSSTYNTIYHQVKKLKYDNPDKKIILIFDSNTIGSGIGIIIKNIIYDIHNNKSYSDIIHNIKNSIKNTTILFSPNNINNLQTTGRIKKYLGILSFLPLYFILEMSSSGKIKKRKIMFNIKKTRLSMLKIAIHKAKKLHNPKFIIIHKNCQDIADLYKKEISSIYNKNAISNIPSSPLLEAYMGNNFISITISSSNIA